MFKMGAFGGTYWRPIYSTITKSNHSRRHLKYDWGDINIDTHLTRPCKDYDISLNKYKVKVGVDVNNECGLPYWESMDGWIRKPHPYGWVEWWCDVHTGGMNSKDYNDYQVDRWMGIVGPKGRFRNWLYSKLMKEGYDTDTQHIRKLKQICLHWGYKPNKRDFNKYVQYKKQKAR